MNSVARQRRKARKKKRSELRISWAVALKLAGAHHMAIQAVLTAGNHALAQRAYEYYINKPQEHYHGYQTSLQAGQGTYTNRA